MARGNREKSTHIERTGKPEGHSDIERRGKLRTRVAIAVALIAAILSGIAVPAVWLSTTIVNEDAWVKTVTPLAEDPAIQKAVASKAAELINQNLDATGIAEKYLPEKAQPLSAPIGGAVESFVERETLAFAQSPEFETIWIDLNRVGHKVLAEFITGGRNQDAIDSETGTVTLDVGVLLKDTQRKLVESGMAFAANLPLEGIDTTVTLFSSPALMRAQKALELLHEGAIIFPIAALVLVAVALVLGPDRRRVALWFGGGVFCSMVISACALACAKSPLIATIAEVGTNGNAALSAIYGTVLRSLYTAQIVVGALGAIIWLVALVLGPSKVARLIRRTRPRTADGLHGS